MKYYDFIELLIIRGIAAAKRDYTNKDRMEGAIAGFEACKNKLPNELIIVWVRATEKMNEIAQDKNIDKNVFWYWRIYQAEIEYVCDVVSAMLVNSGKRGLIKGLPTLRGQNMARKILVERN